MQNKALRLICGCHLNASIDHLHAETGELPVAQHMRLLSAQFLAKALDPGHVSYPYVTMDPGPRRKKNHRNEPLKHTLRSKVFSDVEPFVEAVSTFNRGRRYYRFFGARLHELRRKAEKHFISSIGASIWIPSYTFIIVLFCTVFILFSQF